MRRLLERSRSARGSVAALAALTIVALVHSAVAGGDLGLREPANWFATQGGGAPTTGGADAPSPRTIAPAAVTHRQARRIWAASSMRPLRIALRRRPAPIQTPAAATRLAGALPAGRQASRRDAGRRHRPDEPRVVFAKLAFLPQPPRPAIVSIYQDRTLRAGDAVMMMDGIHLFRGTVGPIHRPGDFVRLTLVASLGWQLRQTLDALDKNPPVRWSSAGTTAG